MSEEVRSRALLYGTECTNGYIELLEHVLQVQTQSFTHTMNLHGALMVLLFRIGLNQNCLCDLYLFQVLQKPTGDQKPKFSMFSKKVAAAVTELIQTAEAMKGKRYFVTHTFIKTQTCSLYVLWGYFGLTVLSKVSYFSCLA